MNLIDQLRAEHDLIEQVAGSLRTFARQRRRGEGMAEDGPAFLRFFRLYAGAFHHAREEHTLFVALHQKAELPADHGPIAVLTADHRRMAALLDALEAAIAGGLEDDAARASFEALAIEYSRQLWHHIDAENSVLLPESEARLRRHGIHELPARDMTPEEDDARARGAALVAAYPPVAEPDVIRGDGCVFCPAFVDDCRGLEHEWWNEWEWEEFEDHLPSG